LAILYNFVSDVRGFVAANCYYYYHHCDITMFVRVTGILGRLCSSNLVVVLPGFDLFKKLDLEFEK